MNILVTGATGYIGGRLVPRLLEKKHIVRALVRDKARIEGRIWSDAIEVVEGNVNHPETLKDVMHGIDVAYYLIHSMESGTKNFAEKDLDSARAFGRAAKEAGVKQIIYLGGLGRKGDDLSEHLESRQKTGIALREAGVPVTEFRAAIIIGSGGISFEIIRYLVERLPILVAPVWVYSRTQPIAVDDVLSYLVAAIDKPEAADKVIEIGGPTKISFGNMLLVYAQERKLNRKMITVPYIPLPLIAYAISLLTPAEYEMARPLLDGLKNEIIVTKPEAAQLFPQIKPMSYRESLQEALKYVQNGEIETSWSDALSSTTTGDVEPFKADDKEGMLMERRQRVIENDPKTVYATILRVGGKNGWFYGNILWQIRGVMDRFLGGPGLRRARRNPDNLRPGDILDFWRVEALEQDKLIRLRAEMRVAGRAWLEWQTAPYQDDPNRTLVTQTAFYRPLGLLGVLYWYSIYPLHFLVFPGMINGIKAKAESIHTDQVKVQEGELQPSAASTTEEVATEPVVQAK